MSGLGQGLVYVPPANLLYKPLSNASRFVLLTVDPFLWRKQSYGKLFKNWLIEVSNLVIGQI